MIDVLPPRRLWPLLVALLGCGDLVADLGAGEACARSAQCGPGLVCLEGSCTNDLTGIGGMVPDLGVDMGAADMGAADMGAADMGVEDLGPPDLGPPDLGPPDLGVDMGAADMGAADMGAADMGAADMGPPDTGVADTGAT